MTDPVLVPGARDVRASFPAPDASGCLVACLPHPLHGGSLTDPRLRAVADALARREIACLRIASGPWDESRGERVDAENAIGWTRGRYDRVGLSGYSLRAAVALVAAGAPPDGNGPPCSASVLAPPARVDELDVFTAVDAIDAPSRCSTASATPPSTGRRSSGQPGRGAAVESVERDRPFVGAEDRTAETVAAFLAASC